MTEYDIDDLDKMIKNYLDSEPLTAEGILEVLLDATLRETADELIVLQGIFTALALRIRDLEAELEKNRTPTKAESPWKNPTDDHASPTNP